MAPRRSRRSTRVSASRGSCKLDTFNSSRRNRQVWPCGSHPWNASAFASPRQSTDRAGFELSLEQPHPCNHHEKKLLDPHRQFRCVRAFVLRRPLLKRAAAGRGNHSAISDVDHSPSGWIYTAADCGADPFAPGTFPGIRGQCDEAEEILRRGEGDEIPAGER